MFSIDPIKKCLLPGVVLTSVLFSATVMADPVILPPDRDDLVGVPTSVFCFKVTGGDELAGGGARIQFELLNWTGEAVSNIRISQMENFLTDSPANTGGLFNTVDPVAPVNGWHITDSFTTPFGELGPESNITFSANEFGPIGELSDSVQTSLQGFDLDLNNDFSYDDPEGPLPDPIDSGFNALDGFILDFPDFGIYERVVLQWDLLNDEGNNVDQHANGTRNPFSFGTFQIDRASNGSIRVATYFSIGTDLFDVDFNAPPLDEFLTEQNAETLPGTALSQVPVPAAAWLFMSGLIGIAGVSSRKRRK